MDNPTPWVRPAAVAGMFYSDDPVQLRSDLSHLLDQVPPWHLESPAALIVPHAGYVYSGLTAAVGYQTVRNMPSPPEAVAVIGPSHRVYLTGLAASSASEFETPLGRIPVHHKLQNEMLRELPQLQVMDRAHQDEHSLEVQLPFLQFCLPEFSMIPLVAGDIPVEEMSQVIRWLMKRRVLVVISTDLSHFLTSSQAKTVDARTARAIVSMQADDIDDEAACGRMPLRGMLHFAKEAGYRIHQLDLRNSGDVSGDQSRVVGYGSWVVNK